MEYGVCWCDTDRYDKVADMIAIFDSYEEACRYYLDIAAQKERFYPPRVLWVAFIENDRVIQLDRLKKESKTYSLPFKMVENNK